MTAPLTDAQVAALRERSEKAHEEDDYLVALPVLQVLALLAERDALVKELQDTLDYYREQGRVVIERDGNLAQKVSGSAEIAILKADGDASAYRASAETAYKQLKVAEAALSALQTRLDEEVAAHFRAARAQCEAESEAVALRARETGLRELVSRWRSEVAEYPTRTDTRALGAAAAVICCARELEAALSTPAVHGASEAER